MHVHKFLKVVLGFGLTNLDIHRLLVVSLYFVLLDLKLQTVATYRSQTRFLTLDLKVLSLMDFFHKHIPQPEQNKIISVLLQV